MAKAMHSIDWQAQSHDLGGQLGWVLRITHKSYLKFMHKRGSNLI